MAARTQTMIPFQVLVDIDSSKNPMQLTRERLERAATENQWMNGKIEAITVRIILFIHTRFYLTSFSKSYRKYLNEALIQNFPDLEEFLNK
jgi:mediator of RNA polymerase II transcription subunit 10